MLHRKLENNLELVVKEHHVSKMVAIQCWVGVGSLQENPDQYGMAHVLEHMLFKGTETRGVGEISKQIEAFGGEVNAYTTFDHTVFYLTLSSEHVEQGIEILADAIFHSSFVAEELKKEQEVILEEIRQSNDSPGQKLGRAVFERIYRETAAARPIIGFAEGVAGFTRDDLVRFHQQWYQPGNMKLVVVGDVDSRRIFPTIVKNFGTAPDKPTPTKDSLNLSTIEDVAITIIRGDFAQPRLELAFPGPSLEDADQVDLDVAAFALGSGDSSRLNLTLRDQLGVSSSIGCSLYSPAFGGVFGVSAIPEPTKILECVEQIGKEITRLKLTQPIADDELQRAVINLRADQIYQDETAAGIARSLGHSLSTKHKTLYDSIYEAKVKGASRESVTNAVKSWIDPSKATIVLLVPEDSTLTELQISDAFAKGIDAVPQADPFNTLPLVGDQISQLQPSVITIKEGITLVYRHNPEAALFSMVAVTEGGLRADGLMPGLQNCFSNLLACSNHRLDYSQLLQEVEGAGAVLAGFSGKDSLGIKMQCFSEQFHHMSRVWAECLLKPVFPTRQWEITQLEIQDELRSENDSPANIAVRNFQAALYGDHPYRYPIYGTKDVLEKYNELTLEQEFGSYRDQGQWIIGAVGSLSEQEVRDHLSEIFHEWKPSAEKRSFDLPPLPHNIQDLSVDKDKEQAHILLGYPGITWFDEDRYVLDILSTVLGGSGGRFFLRLRDQESLAYSVSPLLTYGVEPGAFGAYIACAPEKAGRAVESIDREFRLICDEAIATEELERAKNYLVGAHESEMQRGDSQALTMALMALYGVGHDDFLTYSSRVKQVDASQIQKVAKRIIQADKRIVVKVGNMPK